MVSSPFNAASQCGRWSYYQPSIKEEKTMKEIKTIGLDSAKKVFHLAGCVGFGGRKSIDFDDKGRGLNFRLLFQGSGLLCAFPI